jgi:hypothetical protein
VISYAPLAPCFALVLLCSSYPYRVNGVFSPAPAIEYLENSIATHQGAARINEGSPHGAKEHSRDDALNTPPIYNSRALSQASNFMPSSDSMASSGYMHPYVHVYSVVYILSFDKPKTRGNRDSEVFHQFPALQTALFTAWFDKS